MTAQCFVDGRAVAFDPTDRGLAYGDGLFETMASVRGVIRRLDLHLERLTEGCARLEIPLPEPSWLSRTLGEAAAKSERAVVKLIVTRGRGPRGYAPPLDARPTVVVSTAPWPNRPASQAREGIGLVTCAIRLGENPKLAGIKHLCRLEQVLAQLELRGTRADEGLLLDTSGRVVSGISCNLFAVHAETLRTPRLSRAGVNGVMRRIVMERARELDIEVEETDIEPADLVAADELFVTSTLTGIRPVRALDGRVYTPGPQTRALQSWLEAAPFA